MKFKFENYAMCLIIIFTYIMRIKFQFSAIHGNVGIDPGDGLWFAVYALPCLINYFT